MFRNIKLVNILTDKKKIYLFLTQVTNAILSLASGKLIAEFILPEQFGLYNLQFAAFTFFFSLLVGPSLTYLKASYKSLIPKGGYQPFFSIITILALVLYICIISFFYFFKSGEYFSWEIVLLLLFLIPLNIITNILSDQFNVLDDINSFSSLSVIKTIVGLTFLVICFYLIPKLISDYLVLWGMQVAMGVGTLALFINKLKQFPKKDALKFKEFFNKHFQYTAPLMFLAIWSWINNYFDRYIIEAFIGLSEVGIYNANYSVGSKFFSILNPIFLILLTPLVYNNNTDTDIRKGIIQKYAISYILFGIPLLCLIFYTTDLFGELLLSNNYEQGFYIIFWIAAAYLIMTATFLYETIFYANNKTHVILYSNILSAIFNITLNILLIPKLGLDGAIVAMLVSVFIRFSFIYFRFRQI